jgi:hypothetical protein
VDLSRVRLQEVYWLGGGSGAGKSTIARLIAAEHDLDLYATDEVLSDHAERASPEATPLLQGFMQMRMDQRWIGRDPQRMLRTFPWFHGEGFDLLVNELLQRVGDRPVLVEGFRLLPELVKPLLGDRRLVRGHSPSGWLAVWHANFGVPCSPRGHETPNFDGTSPKLCEKSRTAAMSFRWRPASSRRRADSY